MSQLCMTGCGRLALWCGPCTEVDVEGNPDADWSWNAGYLAGAAAALGLVGMAAAIVRTYPHLFPCVFHCTPYSGGPCLRCGIDDGWRRRDDDEWHRVSPQATDVSNEAKEK